MSFLNPNAFYFLVALSIPILIHFLNRGELRITEFAALRWLSNSKHNQWRRILPTDLLLLTLRIMIFSLLVLWLTEPVININNTQRILYRLVHPDLSESDLVELTDTLPEADSTLYLQKGFPESKDNSNTENQNIWLLLKQFDQIINPLDSIQIIVPEQISISGQRPNLVHQFDWHIINSVDENKSITNTMWIPKDVLFISTEERKDDQQLLINVINSWSRYFNTKISIANYTDSSELDNRTLVINLSSVVSDEVRQRFSQQDIILIEESKEDPKTFSTSIITSNNTEIFSGEVTLAKDDNQGRLIWRTEAEDALIREKKVQTGRWFMIYSRLSTDWLPMLESNQFSRHLLNLIQPATTKILYRQKVDSVQSKPTYKALINNTVETEISGRQSLRNLLLLCVLILLFFERLVSELRHKNAH